MKRIFTSLISLVIALVLFATNSGGDQEAEPAKANVDQPMPASQLAITAPQRTSVTVDHISEENGIGHRMVPCFGFSWACDTTTGERILTACQIVHHGPVWDTEPMPTETFKLFVEACDASKTRPTTAPTTTTTTTTTTPFDPRVAA